MSYILDALKRADADRERGHVPGLHSHKPPFHATGQSAAARHPILVTFALVILVGAIAALAWWSLRTPEAAPPATVALATPTAREPEPLQAPAEADVETEPPAEQAPASLPILSPEPPPPAVRPTPNAPSVPAAEQEADDDPDMVEQEPEAEAEAEVATDTAPVPTLPTTVAPPPRPTASRPPARAFAQGRPEVRVSGSSYSANPAHRMLIANGKVVQEGQEIEPGLRLETIGPRGAVLNHRGTLYNITY